MDRLAVAQISKHVRDVLSTLPVDIVCKSPAQVALIHEYVFGGPEARAPYIHFLAFDFNFRDVHNVQNTAVGRLCATQALELIQAALRLRHLKFPSDLFSRLSSKHVASLTHLTRLTIHVAPVQYSYRDISRTMKKVPISSIIAASRSISLWRMFQVFSGLPRLCTLTLNDVEVEECYLDDEASNDQDHPSTRGEGSYITDAHAEPVLRTIHTLQLRNTDLPDSIPLPQLLPSLRTLQLVKSRFPAAAAYPTHVHHLIVADAADNALLPGSMTVDRLTFSANSASKRLPRELADVCLTSHLVSLTIRHPECFMPWSGSIWDDIASAAPTLRLLEIEHCASLEELVTGISADAVAPKSARTLLCLSLLGSLPAPTAAHDASECHRSFLERAATNIPSLRYIGLAEVEGSISDWQENDFSGTRAPWRWWKVARDSVGDTVPVEGREIPAWEGERVKSFLRNADMMTAEGFDQHFVPYV